MVGQEQDESCGMGLLLDSSSKVCEEKASPWTRSCSTPLSVLPIAGGTLWQTG